MPSITKQKPVESKRAAPVGVLGRIVPVGELTKKMKLLVYGRGKTGKTRLFSTFPKPALLIGTEDGTNSISDIDRIDFVQLRESSELEQLVTLLKSGKYRSVGLDTAGGLQDLILKEVLGLDEIPVQRSWGMARQQDWGTCGAQLKERLRSILNLADSGLLDVAIIAHERNFKEDDEKDELIRPVVGAALTPSATGWLNGACDYVCQTFIREEVNQVKTKVAGKEIVQLKKSGRAEYCLRIGPHPVYLTGFRVRRKVGDLPDCIVDPSYDKINRVIEGN